MLHPARDQLLGHELEIYGKLVVNATGPWINQFNKHCYSIHDSTQFHFIKAVNLIIPRTISNCAFGLKATEPLDDYLYSNRFLFFVPWRGATMIGTWYFDHYSTADGLKLSESEFEQCLKQINQILPDVGVTAEDISFIHLGLVPVDIGLNKRDCKLKKHHCLIEHERYGGPDKLLSVLGVKYTTARSVAAQAIDLISKKLDRKLNSVNVGNQPLAGGDIENIIAFIEEKKEKNTNKLTEETVRHLSLTYGTALNKIEELITADPELGEFIPGSDEAIKAELPYCTRNEFVFHLSDLLFRRTGIGSVQKPKDETINFCADFLAAELGWSDAQKQDEINAVRRYYNRTSTEP